MANKIGSSPIRSSKINSPRVFPAFKKEICAGGFSMVIHDAVNIFTKITSTADLLSDACQGEELAKLKRLFASLGNASMDFKMFTHEKLDNVDAFMATPKKSLNEIIQKYENLEKKFVQKLGQSAAEKKKTKELLPGEVSNYFDMLEAYVAGLNQEKEIMRWRIEEIISFSFNKKSTIDLFRVINMIPRHYFKELDIDFRISSGRPKEELPPSMGKFTVRANFWGMFAVVINILGNAIEAKAKRVTIHLRANRFEEGVVLQLVDSGSGINPMLLKRITLTGGERSQGLFLEGVSTRQKKKDEVRGQGLAYCFEQIKRYGGTIKAENNRNGIGATFTITLPFLSG